MADLTVQCIVKNEEKWIWYALQSVSDIAKKILVYDTGSTDKTVEIIKSIKNKKIDFTQKKEVDAKGLVDLRREQLEKTTTEWFLILDGDEIWPKETLKELSTVLAKNKKETWGVVARAWNLIGDIYHCHPESIRYLWPFAPKNYIGWSNLRAIRTKLPGLDIAGDYPLEYYHDAKGVPLQNYGKKHLAFLKNRYFHTTYLQRSASRNLDKIILNRSKKAKLEIGMKFPKNFKYPQVFYQKTPTFVDSPWAKRDNLETILSIIQTPIKEVRRRALGLYKPKGK